MQPLRGIVTFVGVCVAILMMTQGARSQEFGQLEVERAPAFVSASSDASGGEAACGKCGDNYCNPRFGETAASCPRDCGGGGEASVTAVCGKCGDNYCNLRCGETAASCPRDCGVTFERDDCTL